MRSIRILLFWGAGALGAWAQNPAIVTPSWQDAVQKANNAQLTGRTAEAEALIQNTWANIQRAGSAAECFPGGVQSVVNFYSSIGQGLKAERILQTAETLVAELPSQHPNRLSILILKAQTYNGEGRTIGAQAVYEQLLPAQVKAFGENSFEVRNTLQTLASSYENSGELEKAEALLQRLDSVSILPAAPGTGRFMMMSCTGRHVTMIDRSGFAISGGIGFFGQSALADFYDRHGRFADAEKAYQAAIARAEREDAQTHTLDAALGAYQNYLRNHRRFAEAEQLQLRIMQIHHDSPSPADGFNRAVADRQNLAEMYMEAGQFDQANKTFEQARAELLAGKGAVSDEYRGFQNNYAFALMRQGKLEDATKVAEELAQSAPSDGNEYLRENGLNLLAQIRDQAGDHQSAEAYRAQVAAMQRSRPNDWDPDGIGAGVQDAQTLLAQGEADQAWEKIEHALSATEAAESYKTTGFLSQIANLANAFPEKSSDRAAQLIERVAAIQDRVFTPAHPQYNLWMITNYYANHGRPQDAERTWKAYARALEDADGPDAPRLTMPLNELANLLNQQGRHQDAVATARRALSIEEKTKGPNSNDVIQTLGTLGQFYFNLQEETLAMESYERQVRVSGRLSGRTLSHGHILINVAVNYAQHQQFDRAIELATEAVDIASQPEYEPQGREYFRSVLQSIEQQKAAASPPVAASVSGRTSNRWFNKAVTGMPAPLR